MGRPESQRPITEILQKLDGEDATNGLDELWNLVYRELRNVAAGFVRREKASATLHPTALVSETYLRLFGRGDMPSWTNRAHFFGAATRAMRQLLIERARRRRPTGTGSGWKITLDTNRDDATPDRSCDPLLLVESIDSLEEQDPRAAEVVMLRFFAGLSHEDIARVLDVSIPTVKRDWAFGKAWLYSQIVP